MTITDALRIIIARSPRAAGNAITTMAAARNNSPVLATRYLHTLQMALADPDAEYTPEERAILAEAVDTPESETRGYTLRIRLTNSERDQLQTAADQAGQTMSEFARRRLFDQDAR